MSKPLKYFKIILLVIFLSGKHLGSEEEFRSGNIEIRMCIERVNKCLDTCNVEYPSQYTRFPEYKRYLCREQCITYSENRICSSLFKSSYK